LSLLVGLISVFFAMVIGVSLGLLAGYAGGKTEAFIMRVGRRPAVVSGDPDRAS